MPKKPAKALKPCRFVSTRAKQRAVRTFLTRFGDDLPEEALKKAVAPAVLDRWVLQCDEQGVAAAMRFEHNDWYLCTLKNAAVRPDRRGEGHGSRLYEQTAVQALRARRDKRQGGGPLCLVLSADVTRTNVPSVKALERSGFRHVSSFRWSKKPGDAADIMHFVRLSARLKGG